MQTTPSLFPKKDIVSTAIDRIKNFEPSEGYYLAFSGGKDSIVIKKLAQMAKVKYDIHYAVTTIDPPDLIYYIKKDHKEVTWGYPKKPFLPELVRKGFPTRLGRWCCSYYKENYAKYRTIMLGVRWAESHNRKNRRMVEVCYRDPSKKYVNPIIDWSDNEVWDFIKGEKLSYCSLYDEGFKRIGCLFCPMASLRAKSRELARYPRYASIFKSHFDQLYDRLKVKNPQVIDRWKNGQHMFLYWISGENKQCTK